MTTHQTTAAPGATEAADGRWLHNPATGELAHLLHAAPDGRRLEFDLWLQPGAAVARAHVHDRLVERFEVLTGAVGFRIGDREQQVRPGDGVTEVPAGTVHDWWNAGEGIGQVLFLRASEVCRTSYADKAGKYMHQEGIVLPRL